MFAWLCLGALMLASRPASAQPPQETTSSRSDRVSQARRSFDEGIRAYNAGDLRLALRKMKEAQQLLRRPEFAFNIARVLERMGEADHAISWFRVYLTHGRPSEAEQADVASRVAALVEYRDRVAGQAIAQTPTGDALTEESRTFFNNGVAMFERGQYRAAMQAFQYAERIRPFPELFYNLALTAERLRDRSTAALYYEEYLEGRPNAPGRSEVEAKIRELEGR